MMSEDQVTRRINLSAAHPEVTIAFQAEFPAFRIWRESIHGRILAGQQRP